MHRFVFVCQECGDFVSGSLPHARCTTCGRVHELFAGKVTATSRQVHPIDDGVEWSPWMLPWERPTRPGMYEVKYSHGVVLLMWPAQWDGVVQSWRGKWK